MLCVFRTQVWEQQLHDAVLSLCQYQDGAATRVFAGLADGTVAVLEVSSAILCFDQLSTLTVKHWAILGFDQLSTLTVKHGAILCFDQLSTLTVKHGATL